MNVIEKRSSFAEWSGFGVVLTKKIQAGNVNALRRGSDKATYSFTKNCNAAAEKTN